MTLKKTSGRKETKYPLSFFHLDPLYDNLDKALEPLGRRKYGVNLEDYEYISIREEAKFDEKLRRVKPVLREWQRLGVKRSYVWPILARWRSPIDLGATEKMGQAISSLKARIVEQGNVRRTLQRSVQHVRIPQLSEEVRAELLADCDSALQTLKHDLQCVNKALLLLRRAGAPSLNKRNERRRKQHKARDPVTPETVQNLDKLLTRAVPTRNARSKMICNLLHAWDPENSPTSPASIRSGYR